MKMSIFHCSNGENETRMCANNFIKIEYDVCECEAGVSIMCVSNLKFAVVFCAC